MSETHTNRGKIHLYSFGFGSRSFRSSISREAENFSKKGFRCVSDLQKEAILFYAVGKIDLFVLVDSMNSELKRILLRCRSVDLMLNKNDFYYGTDHRSRFDPI